jgi:hypothetical protein
MNSVSQLQGLVQFARTINDLLHVYFEDKGQFADVILELSEIG